MTEMDFAYEGLSPNSYEPIVVFDESLKTAPYEVLLNPGLLGKLLVENGASTDRAGALIIDCRRRLVPIICGRGPRGLHLPDQDKIILGCDAIWYAMHFRNMPSALTLLHELKHAIDNHTGTTTSDERRAQVLARAGALTAGLVAGTLSRRRSMPLYLSVPVGLATTVVGLRSYYQMDPVEQRARQFALEVAQSGEYDGAFDLVERQQQSI